MVLVIKNLNVLDYHKRKCGVNSELCFRPTSGAKANINLLNSVLVNTEKHLSFNLLNYPPFSGIWCRAGRTSRCIGGFLISSSFLLELR